MISIIRIESPTFGNTSLPALLGLLPIFYLRKTIQQTSNKFFKNYYNSNFILPNLNLAKLRNLKKSKKNLVQFTKLYSNYSMFLGATLTSWFKSPVSVVIINLKTFFISISKSRLLDRLVKENLRFHYKIGTGFFIREAVQVVLLSLSLKDPILFMGWFTKIMEKVQFFRHKNYVMFFKTIFNDLNKGMLRCMGIKGLYFDIRGKLAVKGDSKKRHVLLRYGECTFSQKAIKISPAYGVVHTFTGVLGVTYTLFY